MMTYIDALCAAEELAQLYTPAICFRLQGEYQDFPFAGRDIQLMKKERGLG